MVSRNLERQKEIYEFLKEYIDEHNFSPSIGDIAKEFNLSRPTVFKYLERLREEGYITRKGTNKLEVVGAAGSVVSVPIVGNVACGYPNESIDLIEDYLPIGKDYLGSGRFYASRASGDSMIELNVHEGDYIIIKEANTVENGQLAICRAFDDSGFIGTTFKRVYKEKNRIRLHPENPELKDIYVNNIEVIGVPVMVIRTFK